MTTPEEQMRAFASMRAARRAGDARRYGDPDFPAALRSLIRNAGRPRLPINGKPAWEVVKQCAPELADYLWGLGDDPENWKPLHRDLKLVQALAGEAAARETRAHGRVITTAAGADDATRVPTAKAVGLLRIACSAAGAAAYLSAKNGTPGRPGLEGLGWRRLAQREQEEAFDPEADAQAAGEAGEPPPVYRPPGGM